MAKTIKTGRWIVAAVVAALLLGATVSGAIAFLSENAQKATLVLLFQKFLQPLGSALVAALYLWRDFLKEQSEPAARAEALSQAVAQSAASPQINVQAFFPSPPTSSALSFDKGELADAIDLLMREKGDLKTGVVTAQRLVLADSDGKPRLVFGTNSKAEPGLFMLDQQGRRRVLLVLSEDKEALTPELSFYDEEGAMRFSLGLSDGFPTLDFRAANGKLTSSFRDTSLGAAVVFVGEEARIRSMFCDAFIKFLDGSGVDLWSAPSKS
jgi:hypothetical protein